MIYDLRKKNKNQCLEVQPLNAESASWRIQELKAKSYQLKAVKGFSILEVIVSLAIITVGILAVLSLFTQTIRSGEVSINQEIATNLAQEGIEVIRNKRDSNWIKLNIDWNNEISKTSDYKVNFENNNKWDIKSEGVSGFQKLYLRDDKIYTHNDKDNEIKNISTIFKRRIEIDNTTVDILKITSTVQWTERSSNYSIILKDNLYNWQ
ncbi:prepilin-type N-terminal cleavage/methylation domain-containing protein [Candidatus Kuenenbacteria bacterium]|nr:prepilin-type N-terminal cleavage/methylation domain-containing protein [Candidatus Kuenenbacteria bacterium]